MEGAFVRAILQPDTESLEIAGVGRLHRGRGAAAGGQRQTEDDDRPWGHGAHPSTARPGCPPRGGRGVARRAASFGSQRTTASGSIRGRAVTPPGRAPRDPTSGPRRRGREHRGARRLVHHRGGHARPPSSMDSAGGDRGRQASAPGRPLPARRHRGPDTRGHSAGEAAAARAQAASAGSPLPPAGSPSSTSTQPRSPKMA